MTTQNPSSFSIPAPTHTATLAGETVYCSASNYTQVVEDLMKKYPSAGIPDVQPVVSYPSNVVPLRPVKSATEDRSSVDAPAATLPTAAEMNTARAKRDEVIARENGFDPKPPIYQIGTAVVEAGVENARASQLEHEKKPSARDVCADLRRQVVAEDRKDIPVKLSETRLAKSGSLVLGTTNAAGQFVETKRYGIEPEGFRSLATRCIPASGAGSYLAACDPTLRGGNWLAWAKLAAAEKDEPVHVLRTRRGGEDSRRVFSAVSEGYTAFDADKVAEALQLAFPSDAKGSADYDGFRYRVEGLWHSDVAPNDFVAGEIFKAGVVVRSDDTGGGSLRVQSVIWRNLCLNLIILDKAVGVDIRIRHIGDVKALAHKFRHAFGQALTSVAGFRRAWGAAMHERDDALFTRVQGSTSEDLSKLPPTATLAGILNGILKRDLVEVRGRVDAIVPKLLELHSQDEAADAYGVSRASIVNAFTRYAHQVETDPFAADVIREGAGKLLSARGNALPAPLPFEPFLAKTA